MLLRQPQTKQIHPHHPPLSTILLPAHVLEPESRNSIIETYKHTPAVMLGWFRGAEASTGTNVNKENNPPQSQARPPAGHQYGTHSTLYILLSATSYLHAVLPIKFTMNSLVTSFEGRTTRILMLEPCRLRQWPRNACCYICTQGLSLGCFWNPSP